MVENGYYGEEWGWLMVSWESLRIVHVVVNNEELWFKTLDQGGYKGQFGELPQTKVRQNDGFSHNISMFRCLLGSDSGGFPQPLIGKRNKKFSAKQLWPTPMEANSNKAGRPKTFIFTYHQLKLQEI